MRCNGFESFTGVRVTRAGATMPLVQELGGDRRKSERKKFGKRYTELLTTAKSKNVTFCAAMHVVVLSCRFYLQHSMRSDRTLKTGKL
jgi:hypothetical protein